MSRQYIDCQVGIFNLKELLSDETADGQMVRLECPLGDGLIASYYLPWVWIDRKTLAELLFPDDSPAPEPVWFCQCGHPQKEHYLKTEGRSFLNRWGAEEDYEVETFPCGVDDCDCEDFADEGSHDQPSA